jgi:hypothetical protein
LIKLRIVALALGTLLCGAPAMAQVHGQFMGAETIAPGTRLFGGYLYSSENILGLLTQLRLSFYPNVDFGFQGGLTRVDYQGNNLTTLRVGGGLKMLVRGVDKGLPVNTAIGADLGIETGDNFHILTLLPSVIMSRTLTLGDGGSITPYGRLGLSIATIDIESENQTNVSFPLHLGSEFKIASNIRIAAEFQFRINDDFSDNVTFGGGINMPF